MNNFIPLRAKIFGIVLVLTLYYSPCLIIKKNPIHPMLLISFCMRRMVWYLVSKVCRIFMCSGHKQVGGGYVLSYESILWYNQ